MFHHVSMQLLAMLGVWHSEVELFENRWVVLSCKAGEMIREVGRGGLGLGGPRGKGS